jgi:hypothetical protein
MLLLVAARILLLSVALTAEQPAADITSRNRQLECAVYNPEKMLQACHRESCHMQASSVLNLISQLADRMTSSSEQLQWFKE